MPDEVLGIPRALTVRAVETALARRFDVRRNEGERLERDPLDTFDWRLGRRGLALWVESAGEGEGGVSLVLRGLDDDAEIARQAADATPHDATDLLSGPVADLVRPLIGTRRLLRVDTVMTSRRPLLVRTRTGGPLALVTLESHSLIDAGGRRTTLTPRVLVERLNGTCPESETLERTLHDELGLEPSRASLAREAIRASGHTVGDYHPRPRARFDRGTPTGAAARRLLSELVDIMERNRVGIENDWDPEFTHDYRVALRRARTLLSALSDAFPAEETRQVTQGLRWLGAVTTPVRDHDVLLAHLDRVLRRESEPDARLETEALRGWVAARRQRALRSAQRRLTSKRALAVIEAARALAQPEDAHAVTGYSSRPVGGVADEAIRKAWRRVVRRRKRWRRDTTGESLHALRKRCKRLRYLFEFFEPLYDASEVAPVLRDLERIQDVLGAVHDCDVHQSIIRELAESAEARRLRAAPRALLAGGRFLAHLDERRDRKIARFGGRFDALTCRRRRRALRRLLHRKA